MSDLAKSALDGATAVGSVGVMEMGLQGMVTLRGDLGDSAFQAAVKATLGVDLPDVRAIVPTESGALAWMSPDELLLLCPHAEADAKVASLTEALKDQHHLAVNVSDARVMFELVGEGGALRDVLAKLTPADMRPASLAPGEMRRSRLAQVPAAFWFEDEGTLRVVAFRSVAQYVFDLLAMSAKTGGEVRYHGATA